MVPILFLLSGFLLKSCLGEENQYVTFEGKNKRKAQFQDCFGSQCYQNNKDKKKRDIIFEVLKDPSKGIDTYDNSKAPAEHDQSRSKRKAQLQNCFGSQCNQNNVGGSFGGLGGSGFGGGGFGGGGFKGVGGGASQNCFGSRCNQNNFGRKKRELLSETETPPENISNRGEGTAAADVTKVKLRRKETQFECRPSFGTL